MLGLLGIDADVVAAGVLVLEKHLFESWRRRRSSGRCRARHWGRTGCPSAATNSRFGFVGSTSMLAIICESREAEVRPGLAGVGGLVHAVAHGEVGPDDSRAGADVDDVGVRRRHRDGANRAGGLVVEERRPGGAVVGGAPDAAVVEADVEHVGLARRTGERPRASGPRGSDRAPMHLGGDVGRLGGGAGGLGQQRRNGERECQDRDSHGLHPV